MKFSVETREWEAVDVLVAGGGPAGCAAALAAARQGRRVLLIERQSVLGGMATAGLITHWLGGRTPSGRWVVGGIFRELVEQAVSAGAAVLPRMPIDKVYQPYAWLPWFIHGVPVEPVRLAALLEKILLAAGVDFRYETEVVGVEREGDRIVRAVLHAKDGFAAVKVGAVVDATGDADVAAAVGCATEIGRAGDRLTAPASLTFHLSHVDHTALAAEIERTRDPKFRTLIADLRARGEWNFPYDIFISVKGLEDDEVMVNTSRLVGVNGLSCVSRTAAYVRGRKEALALLEIFRRHFPGFAAAQLKAVAPMLGIRETRRIVSERTLTVADLTAGREFEDTIGFSMYGWDLPDPKRPSVQPLVNETDGGYVNRVEKSLATPIPFGVMVPKGIRNLLCPGRAIGVERDVLGPLRVMASCMAMGEAAGTATPYLVRGDHVNLPQLRATLKANGCIVDAADLPPIEPRQDP